MKERNLIETYIKERIWKRQNEKCVYCGQRKKLRSMTVDHIIPLSKGGADDISNLQCACKMCNRLKNDMMPHEFTEFVRTIFENSMRIEKIVKEGVYRNECS